MCGISGFVKVRGGSGSRDDLIRMTNRIEHRGPDGYGVHCDETAFLGHRRLSIIDVAGGHQPMCNESRSLWITYNGEIFNHAQLKPDLERAGHVYESRCDTETIIHAFEQYGPNCVERFRGMFSFAIWNESTRQLFIARDRLGIKPFYYFFDGSTFVFASEIKAVLEHPAVSTAFDTQVLPEYLTLGFLAGERTFFRGIRKLMPGHFGMLDARTGNFNITQYWDVPQKAETTAKSDKDWIAECRERLEKTVEMRLMSDVPLGMFLSGGVDSSAIAALMKRLRSEPVKTFAVGYSEEQYSELGYARKVAEAIGTDHHEVKVDCQSFFSALPKLIEHEDEPIAWPSSVSLYFVSKLASEHVKVVLTGEGSDELFGGYHRYQHYLFNQRWANFYGAVPGPMRRLLRGQIDGGSLLSADMRRKLQHTFLGRENTVEGLHIDNFYSAFAAKDVPGLLGSEASGSPYGGFLRYWSEVQPSLLQRMLYADQKTYLVELLMKQDQMSMAASIESRVPFLDHTFVEFAASVPQNLKIRDGVGKFIVKRAVEDLLPHDIIYRKKMGFPTPLRQWFRNSETTSLLDGLTDKNGFVAEHLNLDFVRTLIEKQRLGVEDATDRLWRLVNLQIWGKLFIQGEQAEPALSLADGGSLAAS